MKKDKKVTTADEIEEKALKGEDISPYFKNMKKNKKMKAGEPPFLKDLRRTSLDLGTTLMNDLDEISQELNISRQAFIKVTMADAVSKYKLARSKKSA